MSEIWWEKHRPKVLRQFVGQEHLSAEFENIIYNGAPMQHYIFNSPEAGTGKTTLAYILAHGFGFPIHHFNASSKRTRGIEFIEEDISPLAQSGLRETIILLDEADQLTPAAQSALKGVIESASCYFILTCNDLSKVSRWLQSRCQVRTFKPHTAEHVIEGLDRILEFEGFKVSRDDLLTIANIHNGDLRNAIGALQVICNLPDDESRKFLQELGEGFNPNRFLLLAVKERAIGEAVNLIKNMNMRTVVRKVFDCAVNSPTNANRIAKVVESCITSERDLVNGVDESIVKWDFTRMLSLIRE